MGDHGIISTENMGKNNTNISSVNPITEDYNYTNQSPNQTAFMGDHQPQGQTIWIPITIAVVVILVTGLVIIVAKKRKWFRGKIMALIRVFTYLHINICLYFRFLTIADMKEWNSNLRPKSMFDYLILA